MGFKENLKFELSRRGMLVKELSQKSGINQGSLSNYLRESSSIPSADVAVKIAKALGVTVEYLVTDEPASDMVKNSQPHSLETRLLADKIERLSEKEKKIVKVLVDEFLK
ncbi:helix-turn-helix transcriptional regulator [Treponema sp.]|uniref:helix-turn-helix domain-containing protein n=1 Tax=Treponema sp. TaxID=166 RepID=UPI00298E3EA6|nr:helix-turn-helix transcriptional regulator [Treponema sp.]MCQ2242048.1 helix-turn-helix domain-containing protein [Treponema sp.]